VAFVGGTRSTGCRWLNAGMKATADEAGMYEGNGRSRGSEESVCQKCRPRAKRGHWRSSPCACPEYDVTRNKVKLPHVRRSRPARQVHELLPSDAHLRETPDTSESTHPATTTSPRCHHGVAHPSRIAWRTLIPRRAQAHDTTILTTILLLRDFPTHLRASRSAPRPQNTTSHSLYEAFIRRQSDFSGQVRSLHDIFLA
jgi:hypothetical protein